jgi:hypothetical protein
VHGSLLSRCPVFIAKVREKLAAHEFDRPGGRGIAPLPVRTRQPSRKVPDLRKIRSDETRIEGHLLR